MKHIELSYNRAKKLVKAWEGHNANHTRIEDCFNDDSRCPIHKYFMELKEKVYTIIPKNKIKESERNVKSN